MTFTVVYEILVHMHTFTVLRRNGLTVYPVPPPTYAIWEGNIFKVKG